MLGEQVEPKGMGVALHSLPLPWPTVAEFVKHYLTCEGHYQVFYQHDSVFLNHLRHGQLLNMSYYLLGCLKNMSHYCMNAKYPLLSFTDHLLVQLLIQRGLAQQNPPPLNNPPLEPQEAAEIPQRAAEIPQEATETPEVPQPAPKIPQQTPRTHQQVENPSEQQLGSTPDPPKIPPPASANPIDPPTTSTPFHNLAESSSHTIHIPSDYSNDNLPVAKLKRKGQDKVASLPKRQTRASTKEATILEKTTHKRKTTAFSTFLPRRRMRTSTEAATITTTPNYPPISLKPHTPPQSQVPESLRVSPSGTEMQDAQDFVTSFLSENVAATQEPATDSAAITQEPAADPPNLDT